jgi:hypothetical protein
MYHIDNFTVYAQETDEKITLIGINVESKNNVTIMVTLFFGGGA